MAPKRQKRSRGAAKDSPLPPCGGTGAARGAEGGNSASRTLPPAPLPTLPHKGGGGEPGTLIDTQPARDERLLLGDIGRPQGLKGDVRVRSFTEEPASIADYGPLEDETGRRLIEIDTLRSDGKGLVARIKGVASREAAEALTGTKLYISRDRLPEHGEDEWYHADLIGLAARDKDGAPFGTVIAVYNFGASDLIEIRPASGEPDLLVPFTDEAVPEVNVAEGWLRVVPPEEIVVPPEELE